MDKKLLLVVALLSIVLISGCVQQEEAVCGNETCEAGETEQNCVEDCGQPPMPLAPGAGEGEEPPGLPF